MTAAPVEEVDEPDDPELQSSSPSADDTRRDAGGDEDEPRDVLVNGLLGYCWTDSNRFGVTVIHTQTLTSSFTCGGFQTQTNTYTVSGCTPAGLDLCPDEEESTTDGP